MIHDMESYNEKDLKIFPYDPSNIYENSKIVKPAILMYNTKINYDLISQRDVLDTSQEMLVNLLLKISILPEPSLQLLRRFTSTWLLRKSWIVHKDKLDLDLQLYYSYKVGFVI
jgi:hypothetical protein